MLKFFFFTPYRKSRIILWNSGNCLVEEYIRSCVVLERADNWKWIKYFGHAYFNCLDYIHPGYVVIGPILNAFLRDILSFE